MYIRKSYGTGKDDGMVLLNDLWKFEGDSGWIRITPAGLIPEKRSQHMMLALPQTGGAGSILLLGGTGDALIVRGCCKPFKYLTDLWQYDIHQNLWQKLHVMVRQEQKLLPNWGFDLSMCPTNLCEQTGPAMHNIQFVASADAGDGGGGIFSFGGFRVGVGEDGLSDETWILERSNVSNSTWIWREIAVSNSEQPQARYWHSMAWVKTSKSLHVESQGFLVVFGGFDFIAKKSLSDTWIMSLSHHSWERAIQDVGVPEARHNHAMVSRDDYIYMHGGFSLQGYNDLWRLNMQNKIWSQMNAPSIAPPNRFEFAMTTLSSDPNLIYVYGGKVQTNTLLDAKLWRIDTDLLCDYTSYYQVSPNSRSGRRGGGCKQCSTCPTNHYLVSPCAAERDAVCARCKRCDDTEYAFSPCSYQSNTLCRLCTGNRLPENFSNPIFLFMS